MTKYALLIGINYIGTKSELYGCINDSVKLRSFCENHLGYASNNIILMSEISDNKSLRPTRRNILKQMDIIRKKTIAGDNIFFHFSGHGTQLKDVSGDEEDGYDECIVPLDAITIKGIRKEKLIIDDEIKSMFVDQLSHGVNLFGILDCCHSGTGFDLRYKLVRNINDEIPKNIESKGIKSYISNIFKREKKIFEKTIGYSLHMLPKQIPTSANVCLLSGCRDDQVSLDIYNEDDSSESGGVLTSSFLKSVSKINCDITYRELLEQILYIIKKEYNSKQIPQLTFGNWVDIEEKIIL